MKIQINKKKPKGFEPSVEVTTSFIEVNQKFLILKRTSLDEMGKWCFSGGKLEKKETPKQGLIREVLEEVGLFLPLKDIQPVEKFYIKKNCIDFILHVFYIQLPYLPNILLNHEHSEYLWASIDELRDLPLVASGEVVIKNFLEKFNI